MSELVAKEKEVTLLDLLDRILDKGVILFGDVTISVADVDLIYLGLKVLLTSIEKAEQMRRAAAAKYFQHATPNVQHEK
jgi:pantothenate kinase